MTSYQLRPEPVSLDDLRGPFRGPVQVELTEEAYRAVDAAHGVIERAIDAGQVVYGVNTGFGKLADRRISPSDLEELQRRLIASHTVGVGDPLPDEVVRGILFIKLIGLLKGHSGVRRVIVDQLAGMLNADVLPVIPEQGSVGASGDLAPLSHMAAALCGIGEVRVQGRTLPADEGLAAAGLEPVTLGPKEGVALINGTQASTAIALHALVRAEAVVNALVVAGALSLEATAGRPQALDPRIQAIRGHAGQVTIASRLRELVADSAVLAEEFPGRRLQDPYCLRCQPQVMGAALDLLTFAARTLVTEANAVSDNPLMFPEQDEVLSGGNFHGQPVAYAADVIAMALTDVCSLSERRTAMLMDSSMSGLAPFLVEDAGLNCGYQIAQVTAAALVAENRSMAFPASVDSIPTSAGQEDHVSMATHAALRLRRVTRNAAYVAAVELMSAAQGLDLRNGGTPAPGLAGAYARVRATSPFLADDRVLAGEMETIGASVLAGDYVPFARIDLAAEAS